MRRNTLATTVGLWRNKVATTVGLWRNTVATTVGLFRNKVAITVGRWRRIVTPLGWRNNVLWRWIHLLFYVVVFCRQFFRVAAASVGRPFEVLALQVTNNEPLRLDSSTQMEEESFGRSHYFRAAVSPAFS